MPPRITALTAIAILALGVILALWARPAEGEERSPRRVALLIGVSDYDNLPPERDLLGPSNDVRLLRDVLLERGFAKEDIMLLADGVSGAGQPTRRGILSAWQSLADNAGPGDFLFLFYAGHGSQQPTQDKTEHDGLDEIILPKDIGRWDGNAGSVTNAITDNEIAAFLSEMKTAGADVWAVFDACHSATLTRSLVNTEEQSRYVGAVEDLDVPSHLMAAANTGIEPALDKIQIPGNEGSVTAFFAASSSELTPELRLPRGHPDRQYHGLFSYSLAKILRSGDYPTYRELANGLLLDYAARNRRSPTPHFEGNLQGLVLAAPPPAARTWHARLRDKKTFEVFAGIMQGITTGSRLELLDSAGTTLYVNLEVRRADLLTSEATIIGDAATLPDAGLVRVLEPALDMTLSVCPPTQKSPKIVDDVIRASAQLRVGQVPDCDVRIVADEDWLWLSDSSASLIAGAAPEKQVPRVPLGDEDSLRTALEQIARVRALMLAVSKSGGDLSDVALDATLVKDGSETTKLRPGQPARLNSGDTITLALENGSGGPVDVTMLFIDSRYQIQAIWPAPGNSNRVFPGKSIDWRGTVNTSSTLGHEQILVFVHRAEAGTAPMDLSFLSQQAATNGEYRSIPLTRFLYESGFVGGLTRSLSSEDASDVQVHVLTWIAN